MKNFSDVRCVEEIRNRLVQVMPEDRALWGSMTAGEMVCHVRESFLFAMGERGVTKVKLALPGGVVKWIALSTSLQWPKNLPTLPELKSGVTWAPRQFAEDCAGMNEAMERFLALRNNRTEHAMFGAMRPKDWMRWGYLHTDHHLRQFGR